MSKRRGQLDRVSMEEIRPLIGKGVYPQMFLSPEDAGKMVNQSALSPIAMEAFTKTFQVIQQQLEAAQLEAAQKTGKKGQLGKSGKPKPTPGHRGRSKGKSTKASRQAPSQKKKPILLSQGGADSDLESDQADTSGDQGNSSDNDEA